MTPMPRLSRARFRSGVILGGIGNGDGIRARKIHTVLCTLLVIPGWSAPTRCSRYPE